MPMSVLSRADRSSQTRTLAFLILRLTATAVFFLPGCAGYEAPPEGEAAAEPNGGGGQPDAASGGSDFNPSRGGGGSATASGGSGPRTHMYGGAGYAGSGGAGPDAGGKPHVGGSEAGGHATGGSSVGGAGGIAAGGTGGAGGQTTEPVELAAKQPSKASSQEAGNDAKNGNDGDLTTRWCASDGSFPQWWRVDLGAVHSLSEFGIRFQHNDRKYTYEIETSSNDETYVKQLSASKTSEVHAGSFPLGVSARYVRVKVTNAAPGVYPSGTYPTWACFFELSVKGT